MLKALGRDETVGRSEQARRGVPTSVAGARQQGELCSFWGSPPPATVCRLLSGEAGRAMQQV